MTSTDLRRPPHRDRALAVPRLDAALRGRDLAARGRPIALIAGLAAAAVTAGWLIANGHTRVVLAVLVPVPVLLVALHRRVSGPLAGLLLLLILNGVPVVNLGGRLPTGVRVQDVSVMALALLLFAYRDRSEQSATATYTRIARIWGACFVAWWTITVARSVLLEGIPIRLAVLYGRDFLYFAILLPLAVGARLPARSLRIAGLMVLTAAVAYGIGQTIAGLTGVTLSWLVHPAIVADVFGQTTRFYSPMNYVVDTCLFFAGAMYLSKKSPVDRRMLGAVVMVLVASAVLGLTRANYFGIAVGVLAGVFVYTRRHGSATVVLARTVVIILTVIAAVTLFTAITGRTTSLVNNPVVSRVSAGLNDVSNSSGTFGFRKRTDQLMLQVLDTDWPIGLGFLHPAVHYVPGLPSGSIRDSDTGVFNALMTMGLVGVLLIYAPVVYALRELLRVSRRTWTAQSLPRWTLYGGTAWIAWALASSLTLALFFSTPGVAVAAVGLAALARLLAVASAETPAVAAPGAAVARAPVQTRTLRPGRPTGEMRTRRPGGAARRVHAPSGRPARPVHAPAGRAARPARAPAGGLPTRTLGPVGGTPAPPPAPVSAPAPAPAGRDSSAARAESVPMQLSAVIVTFNSSHCVSECIKALRTTLGHCEIIVVDNMSADDTISAVWATDQRVRVLSKGRNAGYGSACNSGVRAARHDHVMLMNPDVLLEHGDLDVLQATLSETPFGIVAPGIQANGKGVTCPQTFASSSWWTELGVMALGPFRPRGLPQRSHLADADADAPAWASGALMLVRRSEFLELGGFDERFFLYYEDQELGHRYHNAGLPIRTTDAVTAVHRGGRSVSRDEDQRVVPMAWCVAGWLELVAMEHGVRRAKLSWAAIRTAHSAGRRLTEWGGDVSGLSRLRRKAEQLRSVEAALTRIAADGAGSEHSPCPVACRIIYGTTKR